MTARDRLVAIETRIYAIIGNGGYLTKADCDAVESARKAAGCKYDPACGRFEPLDA